MMRLDKPHLEYLTSHYQGRLATVAPDGTPQNKPVGYRYNSELDTIDIAGINMERSAKFRNVALHPHVSFVIDDAIGDGASGMRFVEVRGRAEQMEEPARDADLSAYLIRIHPRRIVSWNVGPGEPGLRTIDLSGDAAAVDRPALGGDERMTRAAGSAVARFVAELQQGLDTADATIYNRHFAQDVIWGSPYGATLAGYDNLHEIHERLLVQAVAGPSRYEIVQVTAPAPRVAVAHVRRSALDASGQPISSTSGANGFSEMAMYVLVERDGQWWLAGGQNTPIRPAAAPPPATT
jgi:PPOX class F420-dependent enzyme/OxyR family protein/uncharacterized protein (TIGR02246 family)